MGVAVPALEAVVVPTHPMSRRRGRVLLDSDDEDGALTTLCTQNVRCQRYERAEGAHETQLSSLNHGALQAPSHPPSSQPTRASKPARPACCRTRQRCRLTTRA